MLLPVIIVAKNLYLVKRRKSAHPVRKAIRVAIRFLAVNWRGVVVVAVVDASDVLLLEDWTLLNPAVCPWMTLRSCSDVGVGAQVV